MTDDLKQKKIHTLSNYWKNFPTKISTWRTGTIVVHWNFSLLQKIVLGKNSATGQIAPFSYIKASSASEHYVIYSGVYIYSSTYYELYYSFIVLERQLKEYLLSTRNGYLPSYWNSLYSVPICRHAFYSLYITYFYLMFKRTFYTIKCNVHIEMWN